MKQLELDATESSVKLFFFDCEEFTSDEEDNLTFEPNSVNYDSFAAQKLNLDQSQQLVAAIVLESEVDQNDIQSLNSIEKLQFHESMHHNHVLWRNLQIKLVNMQIDSVVFANLPSGLNEVVLYQVSKILKLDVLILHQSPNPTRFFSFRSISDCGNFNSSKNSTHQTSQIVDNPFTRSDASSLHQSKCSGNSVEGMFQILKFLTKVRSLKLFNPLYVVRHAKHIHDSPYDELHWKDPFAEFFYCGRTEYFEFLTNPSSTEFDMSLPFVYFPLQSQRDLHSEYLVNRFADQLLAIEQLTTLVPQNWKIVVKYNSSDKLDLLTPMFFHRIKRISNLVNLPSCVDSAQLIKHSQFVATINSDEGWKSLLDGKKVLVFGFPWYRNFPGARIFEKKIKFDDIVKPDFNSSDFNNYSQSLLTRTHIGSVDSAVGKQCVEKYSQKTAQTIFDLVNYRVETTFQSLSD